MKLTDGVYAFPQTIERDGVENSINPAAVETSSGVMLVDTGLPGLTEQIAANLDDAGFDWDDVSAVLVTHQDGDHAGSLSTAVDWTDAVVYAHEQCAPYVSGEKDPSNPPMASGTHRRTWMSNSSAASRFVPAPAPWTWCSRPAARRVTSRFTSPRRVCCSRPMR